MPKIKPINCTKSEFIKFIEQDVAHFSQERSIKLRFPKHYRIILQYCGKNFTEKLYCYTHGIKKLPVCKLCGGVVKFESYVSGFRLYCCNKCATSDPERIKKMEQTCLERYGVRNARQNPEIVNKARQTCLERYGVKNPSQNEIIKVKKRKTTYKHYGVENVGQAKEVKDKIAKTHMERYGEANINQAKVKLKNPDIIRFEGRVWVCRCPHSECTKCYEKWYTTTRQLYTDRKKDGTELCTRLLPKQPLISTYELRIRNWLDDWNIEYSCNERSVIDSELDIYIPSKKIAIEFNGTYHHRFVNRIETTGKLKEYHVNKFKKCFDAGIQLISIWQDEVLYKETACKNLIYKTIFNYEVTPSIRKLMKNETRRYILDNFPTTYTPRTQNFGIFDGNDLVGALCGSNQRGCYIFEIYCPLKSCYTAIYNFISKYKNVKLLTNNDHISHQMMLNAGFKLKEIILEESIRTVNNHGSYPTYNSGTSIWTI